MRPYSSYLGFCNFIIDFWIFDWIYLIEYWLFFDWIYLIEYIFINYIDLLKFESLNQLNNFILSKIENVFIDKNYSLNLNELCNINIIIIITFLFKKLFLRVKTDWNQIKQFLIIFPSPQKKKFISKQFLFFKKKS